MPLPAISLETLVVLDAIDTRGSFAAAAEQLNKVPSALSYIIQKSEEELNVTLFTRQGRRSVLTPAGSHLLTEGRKVLRAMGQLEQQTQTIANGWEPRINIALDSIVDAQQIMKLLSLFLNTHPSIELNIVEEVMRGSWESLINDTVDIVIGAPSPAPAHQGLSIRPFITIENGLVASPSHPLTQINHVIDEGTLKGHRTVIVKDSVKSDVPWSANIIEHSQHLYVSSVSQKIAAIKANLGVGFLPIHLIKDAIAEGSLVMLNHTIPFTNPELFIAWKTVNRGKGLAALTTLLLEAR